MPEMDLKQLGFTYNTCGPFTKNKKKSKIKKNKKQEKQNIFTEINLIKLVSNMIQAYGDFKIQQEEQLLIKF